MANLEQGKAVVPSKEHVSRQMVEPLRKEHDEIPPTPIGGIIYNQGKNNLIVGSDFMGKLRVEKYDDKIDPAAIPGRILDLSRFQAVHVQQTGIDGVDVRTHKSITTYPSVTVSFTAEDPQTGEKTLQHKKEDEVLRLFAGEQGGIAAFSGPIGPHDLEEDNALLFEHKTNERPEAQVLFIKPSGEDTRIVDSVDGLHTHLKQLNSEFTTNAPLPLQTKALAALDTAIKKGRIDFHGSDVRQEMYRTHVIALARLATKTDDPKYRAQLGRELPELRTGVKNTIAKLKPGGTPRTNTDTIINGLIKTNLGEQAREAIETKPQLPPGVTLTPVDHKIFESFALEESRDLWLTVARNRSYRDDSTNAQQYLNTIVHKMYEAKTAVEFSDLRSLVLALFESDYKEVSAVFNFALERTDYGHIYWNQFVSGAKQEKVITLRDPILRKLDQLRQSALGEK